ncbi:RidA family protein [Phaeobacter gallaeciensis]|uniref:Translation initiation inhibitor, yjgF family n=1 Tax=Phaeobacter gallaeciensis TaxID=60890 RepID=A0AAD0EF73_9RHOB|nr:RidA family protein [Phaeobacter gallaeciensis]AHD11855.1 Putative translation initiation inhibitor, yjgF family [Phaeobacter gallaeciensis DSM 26640]ATE95118.1 Putative translation initiation inhibitor, yjgF family [Phaeobacter gallaeciensis]ATE99426.1 Putative translation initiation inhibitor, yjgF family [Phaeobacter gallaeciensis]ATF03823.1 Putative translation initiation inhibitor, yjgF family [Phaeobacter gallaeciensis]ATF08016.1 Putative translation initiation inhibitor, yjgF family 
MQIERIGAERSGAGGQALPFSPAVRAGDFVYISGQVAMKENGEIEPGGIEAQTKRTMDNVIAVLAKAGCTLDDVAKVNVWLDDPRDFWTFNRVYAGYFPNGAPARSTVRSQLMVDAKIEIDVTAYKPL